MLGTGCALVVQSRPQLAGCWSPRQSTVGSRSDYSQHRPVQPGPPCTERPSATRRAGLDSDRRYVAYLLRSAARGRRDKWSSKATATRDIFIWSRIIRYGRPICHPAVDSVAWKKKKKKTAHFAAALLQIVRYKPRAVLWSYWSHTEPESSRSRRLFGRTTKMSVMARSTRPQSCEP